MSSLNYTTLREQVASILRKRILDGTIQPGEKIKETEVSKEFSISRGPVREALRQIEQEGLVYYEPNKGCTVKTLTYGNINEVYLIRATLEALAVQIFDGKFREDSITKLQEAVNELGRAAEQKNLFEIVTWDEVFHELIVKEAESSRLLDTWKMFEGENAAVYYTMNRNELMPVEHLKRNHQRILDICKSQDTDAICNTIKRHYMIVPEDLRKKEQGNCTKE
ncbi:MAG: GntR family transcriptional regulator [Lachnospiraceae bacterium]